jgi:hypothetical protein
MFCCVLYGFKCVYHVVLCLMRFVYVLNKEKLFCLKGPQLFCRSRDFGWNIASTSGPFAHSHIQFHGGPHMGPCHEAPKRPNSGIERGDANFQLCSYSGTHSSPN